MHHAEEQSAECPPRFETHASLVEVPEHGDAVLAARRAQGAVGRDRHGVEVALVARERAAVAEVRHVSDAHGLVPACADDERVVAVGRVADAGHPLGVRLLNRELALANRVPQLDGVVARARHDLAVVGRKGDREAVLLVAHELLGRLARRNVPQAERRVPRCGQAVLAVLGESNVRHEVRVPAQRALRVADRVGIVLEAPDHHSLVCGQGVREKRGGEWRPAHPRRIPSRRARSCRAQKKAVRALEALACSPPPHSPREPDTSSVGSVSDTDKDVTQLAWPFSSPRNTRGPLSDILTIDWL